MKASEIKAQHPEAYAEIFGAGKTAGVTAEKDRTGIWLAHIGTDPKTVVEGIKGGAEMSGAQREEFIIKASTKEKLDDLVANNAKDIVTDESKGGKVEKTETENFYAKVKEALK